MKHFKKIINDCKHLIGVYGACLIPENFPLFLLDKKSMNLNQKIINTVQNNNKLVYKILLEQDFDVILQNHKEFCLVYIVATNFDLITLRAAIKSVMK